MRYTTLAVAAAALLTFATAASAQQTAPAPKLDIGEWSGQVTPPDGQTVAVKYDVTYATDTLKIMIRAAEHGTFPTHDVKFEAGKISFRFHPGVDVVCVLEKKEAFYSGTCTGDDGSLATIDMSPPAKAEAR